MNWFELSVKVGANESVPVSLPTIYWPDYYKETVEMIR